MTAWKTARSVAAVLTVGLLGAFAVGCVFNAEAIREVRVKLKPGMVEPEDHHFLGVGDKDPLPDYRLSIRTKTGWEEIGTRPNTSASAGLIFPVGNGIPVRRALELKLVEDDPVESDLLEQLPFAHLNISGKNYDFQIATEWSAESGMEWFFDTPLGTSISMGITLAVLVFILAIIGSLLPI